MASFAFLSLLLFTTESFLFPVVSSVSAGSRITSAHRKNSLSKLESSLQAKFENEKEPLLLRAARGEKVERVPVWLMRQAGRHMKEYRDLVLKYPTFRERSENPDQSFEISMQPFRRYGVDGVILFSDILTPLPGMNIQFDILENKGPFIANPYRTKEQVDSITKLEPEKTVTFTGQVLRRLKDAIGNKATLLGFIGLPFTLATYLIEGKTSKDFLETRKLCLDQPEVMKELLSKLTINMAEYACYMVENGAQVIQMFDSWAASMSARDYEEFCLPYQKQVIAKLKEKHPNVPIILYIKHSGNLLEKMALTGADIISVDQTVSLDEAIKRMKKVNPKILVQGNLDPAVLLSKNKKIIKERTEEILNMVKNEQKEEEEEEEEEEEGKEEEEKGISGHVMNLGHGVEAMTPEENVQFFVETVQNYKL